MEKHFSKVSLSQYSQLLFDRLSIAGAVLQTPTTYKRVHYMEKDPLWAGVAPAIVVCIFIPQFIFEPLLLEARKIRR